jgi:hypothetical protein
MDEHKSWDMIVAEVEALSVDELVSEARRWLELEVDLGELPEDAAKAVEEDLDDLEDNMKRRPPGSRDKERWRGWCAHCRDKHRGLRPDQVVAERGVPH